MSFGCGHPETPENTYTRPNGWRECRTCKRAANKTWKREHRRTITLRQRIFDRASIGGFDVCWHWLGKPNAHGYGELRIGGKSRIAHRAVYEYLRGPISEGRVLHHTCEVRTCVNPKHLVPLTQQEHQEAHDFKGNRAIAEKMRSRTHCPHGHPFDEENTYWTPAGHRKCRTCDRNRWQRRKP